MLLKVGMYAPWTRFLLGTAALCCSFVTVCTLALVACTLLRAKPFGFVVYGAGISFLFSLLPIFPIKLIVGRKMNYPNADDWGHIQVASGLIYYAFLCVVKAHFDAVMEVKTLGYKGILARLSPVARRVSLDCIFFVTLGLTAVSVHLWTMSVSGNDGKGEIFHVKTGFVLVCAGVLQCLCDSVCKQGKSVTDIAYDSTRDETRTILFVRRSSISNSRHLRSRGNPVMFLACGLVGYLFFTNHHQPSAYSRKLHNYYSVLVVLFGFIRSLAFGTWNFFFLKFVEGPIKKHFCWIQTKSVKIRYIKCSSNARAAAKYVYLPLEWISAFLILWAGTLFLFSSKHIISFASYQFESVGLYVVVIGLSSLSALIVFSLTLQLLQKYYRPALGDRNSTYKPVETTAV